MPRRRTRPNKGKLFEPLPNQVGTRPLLLAHHLHTYPTLSRHNYLFYVVILQYKNLAQFIRAYLELIWQLTTSEKATTAAASHPKIIQTSRRPFSAHIFPLNIQAYTLAKLNGANRLLRQYSRPIISPFVAHNRKRKMWKLVARRRLASWTSRPPEGHPFLFKFHRKQPTRKKNRKKK